MDAKQLKVFLQSVPDDYKVKIQDLNFDMGLPGEVAESDFRISHETKELRLPAVGQDYLD